MNYNNISVTRDYVENRYSVSDELSRLYFDSILDSRTRFTEMIKLASDDVHRGTLGPLLDADLLEVTCMEMTPWFEGAYTHFVKRQLKLEAYVAFSNLSNDEQFSGDIFEFVERLIDYAKIYQAVLTDAGIYLIEPFRSRMLGPDYWTDKVPPAYRVPSLDRILKWASDIPTFEYMRSYVADKGIDSMIEAYQAGVPVEDIIA